MESESLQTNWALIHFTGTGPAFYNTPAQHFDKFPNIHNLPSDPKATSAFHYQAELEQQPHNALRW